ncbi:MAG: hypothetical protein N2560_10000 [Ignavibacteria bacterium]|nr:hypothetical protein [Ignavibacteria bacterium]
MHTYHNRVVIRNGQIVGYYGWWETCERDFYCQRVSQCCYIDGKLECIRTSTQYYGNPLDCVSTGSPPQKPLLPPPGKTWFENWDTECYYDTICE